MSPKENSCHMEHSHRGLIRMRELVRKLSVSRSMIYQWMNKDGRYHLAEFPKPIRIGVRLIAWRSDDIDEFITNLSQKI